MSYLKRLPKYPCHVRKTRIIYSKRKRQGKLSDICISFAQHLEIVALVNENINASFDKQTDFVCKGGQSKERSLWFHKDQNEKLSMWRCSNLECEWAAAHEDAGPKKDEINKDNILPKPSEETLRLEPIGDELIKYFAGRQITADILQKNVMQKISNKSVIAFTYRRNGELVSCKFRNSKIKEYWQAKNGEKILYGLDGIKEGNDIVIVEGELDKLSMEQAGIPNCVSVPDGAPQKVSKKLPTKREDSNLRYLSDCYGHVDKASRIVLATDGDQCDNVLRRCIALYNSITYFLGFLRCWRVTWPKKDESSCYKDANEVLVHLGAEALRHIVETAEKYEILDDPTADEVNKKPSEETLRLEPLGDKLIEYFAGRKISADILQKNAVMQMIDDKNVIAFTYRRNGELVNCTFYSITSRKLWQAKNGERILYGLDGIKEGNDIVIVADELDKLSMEQAGIPNCISLPVSALQKASKNALSDKRKDLKFKYLLDCNGVKNASRIILATHGNRPGPGLAELSSVLGKERFVIKMFKKTINE
ncbi:toprim domain, Twinkle-like protein [Artemisia annua]|uniref:Toprim domain, Twinkle-like protein n=1 Tax=Artemisia annua TaxID=35608 RepID=A0A2U1MWC9_ARTAN|nr:toprim domain, Twinkle-like protein [Artemisia annua]